MLTHSTTHFSGATSATLPIPAREELRGLQDLARQANISSGSIITSDVRKQQDQDQLLRQQFFVAGMLKALAVLGTASEKAAFIAQAATSPGANQMVKEWAIRAAHALTNQRAKQEILTSLTDDPEVGASARDFLDGRVMSLRA